MRLDLTTRTRVITLEQNGLSYQEIKRHLAEEDIIVSLWKLVDSIIGTVQSSTDHV